MSLEKIHRRSLNRGMWFTVDYGGDCLPDHTPPPQLRLVKMPRELCVYIIDLYTHLSKVTVVDGKVQKLVRNHSSAVRCRKSCDESNLYGYHVERHRECTFTVGDVHQQLQVLARCTFRECGFVVSISLKQSLFNSFPALFPLFQVVPSYYSSNFSVKLASHGNGSVRLCSRGGLDKVI